jgi:glutaredoxin 3
VIARASFSMIALMAILISIAACEHREAFPAPNFTAANARTLPVQEELTPEQVQAEIQELQKNAKNPIIIYGAEWCEPCKMAEAYLKSRGIATLHRDVEKDQGALRELQAKLATAGVHVNSIPVLDVYGTIVVGYNQNAIDEAIRSAHPTR